MSVILEIAVKKFDFLLHRSVGPVNEPSLDKINQFFPPFIRYDHLMLMLMHVCVDQTVDSHGMRRWWCRLLIVSAYERIVCEKRSLETKVLGTAQNSRHLARAVVVHR